MPWLDWQSNYKQMYLPNIFMYYSSNFKWYFFRYRNNLSVPSTCAILTSWSLLLSPIKNGYFLKIYIVLNLPLRRTSLQSTKYQASSRSNYNRRAVLVPWNNARPLWHCNPDPCDKTKLAPNRSVSIFFCYGWRLCSEASHHGALYLYCDSNPKPSSREEYLEELKEVVSDFNICHARDKRSKINIIQVIKNLGSDLGTSEIDLEAGSLTTSLSSIMPGCPLKLLSILIYLLILLFLTGLSTLITTFWSSVVSMPVYTSEYLPLPILVMI